MVAIVEKLTTFHEQVPLLDHVRTHLATVNNLMQKFVPISYMIMAVFHHQGSHDARPHFYQIKVFIALGTDSDACAKSVLPAVFFPESNTFFIDFVALVVELNDLNAMAL